TLYATETFFRWEGGSWPPRYDPRSAPGERRPPRAQKVPKTPAEPGPTNGWIVAVCRVDAVGAAPSLFLLALSTSRVTPAATPTPPRMRRTVAVERALAASFASESTSPR